MPRTQSDVCRGTGESVDIFDATRRFPDEDPQALSNETEPANGRARAQTELAQFEPFVSFRCNVGKDLTIERHAAGKEQEAPALTAGIGAAEKP